MNSHPKIWLTGASGFLGSGIAEQLLPGGYELVCTIRNTTDLWRCREWADHPCFTVVNTDREGWFEHIKTFQPDVLIHSAWAGVGVNGRDDAEIQQSNITYSMKLLEQAAEAGVRKVIITGSQAEYGVFNKRIREEEPLIPVSAYGIAKVELCTLAEAFCQHQQISFYWLRLFSFFGKKEDENWLVSSVVKKIRNHEPVDLTACEQYYDYCDLGFLTACIEKVIEAEGNEGIYNLGSDTCIQLKTLIGKIAARLHAFSPQINFGVIPYRENQVMHMEGDSTKFYRTFGIGHKADIDKGLEDVISFLEKKYNR